MLQLGFYLCIIENTGCRGHSCSRLVTTNWQIYHKKKDYLPTFFAKGILNIFLVRLEWLWSFKHHCTTTANLSNGNKEASDHCCQINYSISLLALSLANVG